MNSGGWSSPRRGWRQRRAQLALQPTPVAQLPVHAGLEEAEPVPPAALGAIEGDVGMLQQLRIVQPVGRQQGHVDADRHQHAVTVEIEWLTEGVQDATAKLLGVRGPRQSGL